MSNNATTKKVAAKKETIKPRYGVICHDDKPHVIVEYYDRDKLASGYGYKEHKLVDGELVSSRDFVDKYSVYPDWYKTYRKIVIEIKDMREAMSDLGKWVFCQYCCTVRQRKPNTYNSSTEYAQCGFCGTVQGDFF